MASLARGAAPDGAAGRRRRGGRAIVAEARRPREKMKGWKALSGAGRPGQAAAREFDPVACPQGEDFVVEIVAAVVQHAGAQTVTAAAMVAVPVAYPDIAAGFFFEHEGEVFGAHGRRTRPF